MILADIGSSIDLSGAPDARWDDHWLDELNQVKGEDFEVVDESSLQAGPDSAAARSPKP